MLCVSTGLLTAPSSSAAPAVVPTDGVPADVSPLWTHDGRNPNGLNFSSGPAQAAIADGPTPIGTIQLRYGTYDGRQYSWTRLRWYGASGSASFWAQRRYIVGGVTQGTESLGWTSIPGPSGYTAKDTGNAHYSWTPMYYNPPGAGSGTGYQMRACAATGGNTYCTAWW
ncbi:hypothetical protein DEH69_10430 [Streptomyces sp. PT12]|nr:hypothetical protein DEH69_10430 [Streptomyces sp. PT12]